MAQKVISSKGGTSYGGVMKIDTKSLDEMAKNYSPRNRPWDSDEVEVLRKYYKKVPISKIAEKLGRSVHSCANKVKGM